MRVLLQIHVLPPHSLMHSITLGIDSGYSMASIDFVTLSVLAVPVGSS